MTTEVFLTRNTGDGIRIDLSWDVADKVRLDIVALNGKIQLDTFEVPVAQAMDAFNHTARYSEPYTEALT